MQAELHPVSREIKVTCGGCDNQFSMFSTLKVDTMRVELCNNCHPAYTGKRKISKAGKIERFSKRFESRNTSMVSKTGADEKK